VAEQISYPRLRELLDAGAQLVEVLPVLAGALFLVFIVAPDDGRFYWTPLTIGLAYLGAAIAGGRDGGHWATACALTGWGAAVVLAGAARPDLDVSGLYLTGAGLGAAAGLLLQRAGLSVNPMGLAVTITGGGLALALTTQAPGLLDDARTYAALIGAVAVGNIALALAPRLRRTRTQPPATSPEHHTQDPNLDREVSYD
jgi:hypothetical protein